MKNTALISTTAIAALLLSISGASAQEADRTILPQPDPPFKGKIGLTPADSVKDFPKEVTAPEGAPNILLILTDDVGFGASSTFGGPVPTPTMDRIANAGLRFNNFHTTALCSPTRAALLTGRNHHSVATGVIMEAGSAIPATTRWFRNPSAASATSSSSTATTRPGSARTTTCPTGRRARRVRSTSGPSASALNISMGSSAATPTSGLRRIVENTRPIEPPHDDPNYNFDDDMADKAIAWLRMQHAMAPNKPFFAYYAPGTAHAPHHAPKEWIEKFKGKFDQGWDKQRELTIAKQKEHGHHSAQHAAHRAIGGDRRVGLAQCGREEGLCPHDGGVRGALSRIADYQMGRIIDAIEEMGQLDNTLVIYIQGDNGASAEGSRQGLLNEMTFFNNLKEPSTKCCAAWTSSAGR